MKTKLRRSLLQAFLLPVAVLSASVLLHSAQTSPQSLQTVNSKKSSSDLKYIVYRHTQRNKMSTLVVTGAGDSSYDGNYSQSGTYNSSPYWEMGSVRFLYWDGFEWALDTVLGDGSSSAYISNGANPDSYEMGWMPNMGTDPSPTVTGYPDPQTVPQGGSGTVQTTPYGGNSPDTDPLWDIAVPGADFVYTVVASSQTPNGWSVTPIDLNDYTVSDPSGATVQTYILRYVGSDGSAQSSNFDVVTAMTNTVTVKRKSVIHY